VARCLTPFFVGGDVCPDKGSPHPASLGASRWKLWEVFESKARVSRPRGAPGGSIEFEQSALPQVVQPRSSDRASQSPLRSGDLLKSLIIADAGAPTLGARKKIPCVEQQSKKAWHTAKVIETQYEKTKRLSGTKYWLYQQKPFSVQRCSPPRETQGCGDWENNLSEAPDIPQNHSGVSPSSSLTSTTFALAAPLIRAFEGAGMQWQAFIFRTRI